jgi:hypothetical protein
MKCTKVLYTEKSSKFENYCLLGRDATWYGYMFTVVAPKCLQISTRLHGITSQKRVILIVTACEPQISGLFDLSFM